MKFFFSGEIDKDAYESYREVRQIVSEKINKNIGNKSYGDMLDEIAIIPMLQGPKFSGFYRERRLVQRKQRSADYRLIIDFDEWQSGTLEVRIRLLLKNIISAIEDINRKLKGRFDGESLKRDIVDIFKE